MTTGTPTSRHKLLLNKHATLIQQQIYEKWPEFLGFSDKTLDPEKLEAMVFLALFSGGWEDRVVFCAPIEHENWVIEGFNSVSKQMFTHCRNLPNPVNLANGYSKLFQKVLLTGRLLQLTEEPPYWVSFGFSKDDPLPTWMPHRLL